MNGVPLSVAQRCISLAAAQAAVVAAIAAAERMQVLVNVAVVDGSGLPVAFARMTGAPLHSIDIAIDKAYTAVSFGLATGAWTAALAGHSVAVREGLVLRPRFVAFGGGLAIVDGGERIGAIGVSGGSEEQDEAIACAALAALPAQTPAQTPAHSPAHSPAQ
jgi:uncharacterized protein GlcG (DUF336 family)